MRKWMLLGLFTLFTFAGAAQPVHASACATDLGNCYGAAAGVDGFWMRWAAGIDCELNFVQCVRITVAGY